MRTDQENWICVEMIVWIRVKVFYREYHLGSGGKHEQPWHTRLRSPKHSFFLDSSSSRCTGKFPQPTRWAIYLLRGLAFGRGCGLMCINNLAGERGEFE
jgi:hypothetical protein